MGERADSVVLLACVCGVWLTWSTHDYLQERVFRAPAGSSASSWRLHSRAASFLLSWVHAL